MRIKTGFILKEVAGEFIAIPFDSEYESGGAMVSLNSTGAFLWENLQEEQSEEDLCKALMEQYGIDIELAKSAVDAFVSDLKEAGLLEM